MESRFIWMIVTCSLKKQKPVINRPVMCVQSTMDWHYKLSSRKPLVLLNVYVLYNLDQVIYLCRNLHIASFTSNQCASSSRSWLQLYNSIDFLYCKKKIMKYRIFICFREKEISNCDGRKRNPTRCARERPKAV